MVDHPLRRWRNLKRRRQNGYHSAACGAEKISVDLFVNFAQFVYDDLNPENPIGASPQGLPKNDSFLLGWQVGAKINFPHDFYFQVGTHPI